MPRSREILLPRDSQPQEAAELAGSNFSWVGTSLQAVDGSALAQAGNVFTRGATPAGVGYNITTAASGALTHAVPTRSGAQPFTIVHQIYSAGRAFDWHTIFVVGTRFVEVREESGGKLQVYVNGAYQIETSSSIFGTPGTYTIGITYDGATASLVLNGVLIGTYASTNLGSATSTPYKIGDDYWQYAKVCTHTFAHYLTEARSVPWLVDATRNPWQLFAPQTIWVPVSAGGGTPTLTVPDSAHAHTLDNVVLTSSTALVVQDMAHGHALDAATLSTGTALTVADSLHAHALDNVTLSTTGAVSLTVADSLHAHTLDAVVLTSQTDLAAADMAHGHALDGVTLTLGGISLVIAEIMHAHALDNVALTLDTYLAVADILHAHTIDNVLVSIPGGTLDLILKILVNRQELNPATGTFTLYDDDGTTVLYTTNAWADAAGTTPYSGGALRRIDALF